MSDIGDVIASQGAVVNGILGLGTSIAGLVVNAKQNKRNLAQQQWANAQNVRQAELAYQRSKPTTQVGNMMQAGMSRAGALNAINGGGSYTPAPVSAGQEQMLDFSGVQNALANIAQMKMAERMQDKQLQSQEMQQSKALENAKEIAQIQADSAKYGADKNYDIAVKRYNLDKDIADKLTPKQIAHLDSVVAKNKADTALTDTQTKDLAYRIAEYQSQEYKSVRDAQKLIEGLEADFKYKITQKSFSDYLNENYTYNSETGEYEPKQWISDANKVQQGARAIWNTIFEIIPLNLILEALGGTVENVRAIKLLSKIK